ncbi:MAG: tetratricopeptide repeat protein [Rudaea sp.]
MTTREPTEAARDALRRGDTLKAEALCRAAIAADEHDSVAWTLLGTALRHRDPAAAESALRRALAVGPASVDARFHLGNLFREQGRLREAIAEYERALAILPDHPSLRNNLGLALFAAGDFGAAEGAYRAVLAHRPGHRQALANLLHVLCKRRRYRDAVGIGERYLREHAEASVDFWIDYGIARYGEYDHIGAIECFRRALRLAPADATALANLATLLVDRRDFVEAEPIAVAASAAAPDDLRLLSRVAHVRAHLCRWAELDALHATIAKRLAADARAWIEPLEALAMPLPPILQRQSARGRAASTAPACPLSPPLVRERGDRLRVGYVSSDFREHALAFLATEVWERHDRRRVATFAYAIGAPDRSSLRARIAAAFETFRDCHADAVDDVARRIRSDGIDVLVDLNGYTGHARSEILAARPGRVQVQWLGYLGTMGAPWIDYVVTDRYATPPAMQAQFDERFLYLPDCYCPSDTRRGVAAVGPDRAASGLPPEGFVFCCFNEPYKLLPAVFDVWMRLLREVDDAVLWLSPSSSVAAENLRREAAVRGVDASRLVLAPRVPIAEHLARHVHADLFLDTTPYNGGTTTNDALFMGVPLLTCSQETMASRVAGSQLRAIGMPGLVTKSLEEYEARALSLARDRAALAALRAAVAENRLTFPLFDMARFTTELEAAFAAAANGRVAPAAW